MGKIIIKNCNVAELDIPMKYAQKLYQDFAVRHPNAFYLRTRTRGMQNWDGKVKYISKTGQFKIGLLPAIVDKLHSYDYKDFEIIDMRQPVPIISKPIDGIGKYKLRPEQLKAVSSILHNKVAGKPFHIGVIDYTVNAGKSLIMSAVYLSFQRKLKTLLITQDSDWLKQAQAEFKEYLPNEDITFIQGGNVSNWANFSIGMVQSLSRNVKKYQKELSQVDMVLVDEADLAGSKTYQNVITHLFNTRVRIGLSGTIYMSNLAKDKINNMNLESFFGKKIAEFRLKDSIKKGYSTNTVVKMVPAHRWLKGFESEYYDYQGIYNDTITENPISHKIVGDRLKYNIKYGRLPALVVCKLVKHAENLYKYLSKELADYKIAVVHVDTPTKLRNNIMKDFREGKIDILISTTIISRGKNFSLLRYMVIAGSMDSQERSIQFLGRLVRTHESKRRAYLDDIHYPGDYLNRHGNHRKSYYKKEGLKVIELDKLWKKHIANIPNFE